MAFDCNNNVNTYEKFNIIYPGLVNTSNAICHHIVFQVNSDVVDGHIVYPTWLKTSREIRFPQYATPKDLYSRNKWMGITDSGYGESRELYKTFGVATDAIESSNKVQTFQTTKTAPIPAPRPTFGELYNIGRGIATSQGSSSRSIITSEYVENQGPQMYDDMSEFYRGAKDQITSATGETDVKKMGLFGEYGGDGWYVGSILGEAFSEYEKAFTTKLYNTWQPGGGGFQDSIIPFLTGNTITYRNTNLKTYFDQYNSEIVIGLLALNEKIKVTTKTYQNQDRERNSVFFTFPYFEDLESTLLPDKDSVLFNDSGEIIPFANGEITVKSGGYLAVDWQSIFKGSLWGFIALNGAALWDTPGFRIGKSSTSLNIGFSTYIKWKPTGQPEENWVSGQNGAPTADNAYGSNGMFYQMIASSVDAMVAASDVWWSIRDRVNNSIEHVPYTSNKGSYTPQGGTAGFNLNGHGPLNRNAYDLWYIKNGKKGIALLGKGSAGNVIIYENTYLPHHVFEMVTIGSNTFKAYGNQTVIIPINSTI